MGETNVYGAPARSASLAATQHRVLVRAYKPKPYGRKPSATRGRDVPLP